jgi:hypothetical protein
MRFAIIDSAVFPLIPSFPRPRAPQSDAGAHGLLAELLASGASGASPLLDAAVGMLHMASRDIATVTVREVKAAEGAFAACREMLEVPVHTAMLAMCCAAPPQAQHDPWEARGSGSAQDGAAAAGGANGAPERHSSANGAGAAEAAGGAIRRSGSGVSGGGGESPAASPSARRVPVRAVSVSAVPAWVGDGSADGGGSPNSRA